MAAVISLQKGQKIDLTKGNPGLSKIIVGLGWDTNKYSGGKDFDLDASVFLTDKNGKAGGIEDFIYYNNLVGGNGSVKHLSLIHISEPTRLGMISYAVFCLKKKKKK